MSHGPLAHHFEDLKQQRESATLGMWLFLLTEIMFFGGLFTAYLVYRFKYPEAFIQGSHHLDISLGGINTVILIGSSLTMALAVHTAHGGKKALQVLFLLLTVILGAGFLGIKSMEYAHKFHEHLVPGPHFNAHGGPREVQIFFSLYFAMTGMHALHMVIGMVIILILALRASQGKYNQVYFTPIEMTGLYWHFVDIVWIFLFPLLYLIGRHV